MSGPTKRRREKPCDCARCKGLPDADPVYGYDRAKVPAMGCLHCEKPIGSEPFVEVLGLARFGAISFLHARCETPAQRRARWRMARNWIARQERKAAVL